MKPRKWLAGVFKATPAPCACVESINHTRMISFRNGLLFKVSRERAPNVALFQGSSFTCPNANERSPKQRERGLIRACFSTLCCFFVCLEGVCVCVCIFSRFNCQPRVAKIPPVESKVSRPAKISLESGIMSPEAFGQPAIVTAHTMFYGEEGERKREDGVRRVGALKKRSKTSQEQTPGPKHHVHREKTMCMPHVLVETHRFFRLNGRKGRCLYIHFPQVSRYC